MLGNLIDNALKYGGAVEVLVSGDAINFVIRVLDHGPGIPQEELDAVFQPFTSRGIAQLRYRQYRARGWRLQGSSRSR